MLRSTDPEWMKERAYLQGKIDQLHLEIISPDLNEQQTNILRGKLIAWRERISDAEASPISTAGQGRYHGHE